MLAGMPATKSKRPTTPPTDAAAERHARAAVVADLISRARQAQSTMERSRAQRDEAIVLARLAGASVQQLVMATGMTAEGIRRLIARNENGPSK